MHSRAINSLLITVSVCLAITAVEVALRFSDAYAPPEDPVQPRDPQMFQADAGVGYRLWPSRTVVQRYPRDTGPAISITSNSDGFRNSREFGSPDDRRRILAVGDSFVFGQGVPAEDRLTEQLEILEPNWRVDNMAMTGWGVDLMLRAIEQYAPKAKADVVVLAVYTDDFRRLLPYYAGTGYAYPKFELQASALVTVPFPYPRWWERSRIVQWLYQMRWNADRNRFDLNEALLDRFLSDSRTLGFRPVVAFLPGRDDTQEDEARRTFLREWALRRGVLFTDLTSAIHGAGVANVFIADNWHWNAQGHRIAARQLLQLLRQLPNEPVHQAIFGRPNASARADRISAAPAEHAAHQSSSTVDR